MIEFRLAQKNSKFERKTPTFLTFVSKCENMWDIFFSKFVAFSKYFYSINVKINSWVWKMFVNWRLQTTCKNWYVLSLLSGYLRLEQFEKILRKPKTWTILTNIIALHMYQYIYWTWSFSGLYLKQIIDYVP